MEICDAFIVLKKPREEDKQTDQGEDGEDLTGERGKTGGNGNATVWTSEREKMH